MVAIIRRVLEARIGTFLREREIDKEEDKEECEVVADVLLWVLKGVTVRTEAGKMINDYRQHYLSILIDTLTSTASTSIENATIAHGTERGSHFKRVMAQKLSELFLDYPYLVASSSSSSSSSRCSPFWKQRLWSSLFPSLFSRTKNAKESDPGTAAATTDTSSVCLLAICRLVNGLPLQIIKSSFTELVEVMVFLASIDSASDPIVAGLKIQSVFALQILLDHDAKAFGTHLTAIVALLLTQCQSGHAAKERAAAIKGLLAISDQIQYTRLYPFKKKVLKVLMGCLNDRKAAVRQLASRAKNYWILLK